MKLFGDFNIISLRIQTMNKSLNTEKVEQTEKRFLNLSADRLDLIKAFGLLVQRDSDTARINPNAY